MRLSALRAALSWICTKKETPISVSLPYYSVLMRLHR